MAQSRVKQSVYNMISGFGYHFLTLILSFVSRTIFIQVLGKEYLGLNGIFSDVLGLLSMADLGFGTAMAYSFYKPLANKDEKTLAALVCFYKRVYNIIAIVVTVVGIGLIPFLPYIVNTEQEIPHLTSYYLISLANIILSYLFVYKTTILTADQKDYEVVKIRMWTTLIKTVLQMGVLLVFKNYILYLLIGIICQFINNLIASRKAEKTYPFISGKEVISNEMQKDIFENMKSVFLYKLSSTLFGTTDNILISILVGTAMVGVYSNYLMVSNKLLLIIQIVFSALTAGIGNLIVTESSEKRYEIFSAMQSVSFILCGVISCVFFLVANDLVYVWLGETYILSMPTIIAVTLNTYLACVLQPLWSYREATGLYKRTKYVMFIGAVLNIILSIIGGYIWGIAGIIFASAVARLCTYFWYEPKLLFKEYFNKEVWKYYGSFVFNLLLVIFISVLLQFIFKDYAVDGWIPLIIKGAVAGTICGIVFLVAYSRTEGFKVIINKAKTLLRR